MSSAGHGYAMMRMDIWTRAVWMLGIMSVLCASRDCAISAATSASRSASTSVCRLRRDCQKEYGSFEEIFESYIYGYQFWKNDSDDDRIYFYRRAAGEAVENIQSEYNTELVKDWE